MDHLLSPAEHYREACLLAEIALNHSCNMECLIGSPNGCTTANRLRAQAQVHATLATVNPATYACAEGTRQQNIQARKEALAAEAAEAATWCSDTECPATPKPHEPVGWCIHAPERARS